MGRLQRVRPRPLALPRQLRCRRLDLVKPRPVLGRHRSIRRPPGDNPLYDAHDYGGIGGAEIGMGRLQRVRPRPLALPRLPRCLPGDFVQPRLVLGRHRPERRSRPHDYAGIRGAEIRRQRQRPLSI